MSFDEWFEGAYGKEPYPQKSIETLRGEIHGANKSLLRAEECLRERQEWEARRDGARAARRELEGELDELRAAAKVVLDGFFADGIWVIDASLNDLPQRALRIPRYECALIRLQELAAV